MTDLKDFYIKHEDNLQEIDRGIEQIKFISDYLFRTLQRLEKIEELKGIYYLELKGIGTSNDILNDILLKVNKNYEDLHSDFIKECDLIKWVI